jgi:hypothetical protein
VTGEKKPQASLATRPTAGVPAAGLLFFWANDTHKEVIKLPREGNNYRSTGLLQYKQRRALLR